MILVDIIIWLVFAYFAISVVYLLLFSIASKFRRRSVAVNADLHKYSIAVLIPAYKEDRVIVESVESVLVQNYDRELFSVVVIADAMRSETIELLRSMGAGVVVADYEESTKAKALNLALKTIAPSDLVVVLDADNVVEPGYLSGVNSCFQRGLVALQTHRKAKNMNTPYSVLDAVSEEINNSIFRQGHVALGLSAALIGSGMVFRYDWLRDNMPKISSVGEDKELEFLLFEQRVFVDYRDDLCVYDHKIERPKNFYNQRRRWLAAQFSQLIAHLPKLPGAIVGGNIDLVNKIFEQMLLPRILLLGALSVIAVVWSCVDFAGAVKWLELLGGLVLALMLAVPAKMYNKTLFGALLRLPVLAVLMLFNLFRIKGATKRFIHTDHK